MSITHIPFDLSEVKLAPPVSRPGTVAKTDVIAQLRATPVPVATVVAPAGYGLFQHSPPDTVAFVLAFAAGAILTMLANTMMPEAFEHGGKWVGVVTTLGFAVAFAIHTLD